VTELAFLLLLANAEAPTGSASTGAVIVESATTCPSAAEVDARLRVLLPQAQEGAAPKRATHAAARSSATR